MYVKRVLDQRMKRQRQQNQYQRTIYKSNSKELSTHDLPDRCHYKVSVDEPKSPSESFLIHQAVHSSQIDYTPDENDDYSQTIDDRLVFQVNAALYLQASMTTCEAVRIIMKFCIESNLDQQKTTNLLDLIKSMLPMPNELPITLKQIQKVFGKTPSSHTKFYCNDCLTLTTSKSGYHYCMNSKCRNFNSRLTTMKITEIVCLDVREQIQSVIRRNFSFFTDHRDLFPRFDIPSGRRYKAKTDQIIHPISLNLHADGAPLVRSTKSSLWPCFASITELPPPVREFQSNILTLSLWFSSRKPDVNLFLQDTIQQLEYFAVHGTRVFANDQEFEIFIKPLFFVSDLPAKSLFMKTINFNGYFACTVCMTKGTVPIDSMFDK